MKEFNKLLSTMEKLLGKNGCPWDKKQTHLSLLKYLKEETGEFSSAVKRKNFKAMQEELGDVLLQVVFHCALAEKKGVFSVKDVIASLNSKLIRRHPHVFLKPKKISVREVLDNWKKIKKQEKKCK